MGDSKLAYRRLSVGVGDVGKGGIAAHTLIGGPVIEGGEVLVVIKSNNTPPL